MRLLLVFDIIELRIINKRKTAGVGVIAEDNSSLIHIGLVIPAEICFFGQTHKT
jgi:hypothetical protein